MQNNLVISSSAADLFPNVEIAVITGELLSDDKDPVSIKESIEKYRKVAFERLQNETEPYDFLSQHPHIAAWREAYQRFGVKAKKHPPTHEAMAKRLLKTQTWPDINPIVDIYLANQVEWLLPHGGYDVDRLDGDVTLQVASEGLLFIGLGNDIEPESIPAGEIIYTDNQRVLTRRWNYRDCDETQLRSNSKRFWLAIESPDSQVIQASLLHTAADSLAEKLAQTLDADTSIQLFSAR